MQPYDNVVLQNVRLRVLNDRLVAQALSFTGAPLYRRLLYALKGKLP